MTDSEKLDVLTKSVTDLVCEVRELREEVATIKRHTGAPAKAEPFGDEPVPQPVEIIAGCAAVEVHFGKNKGAVLANLTDNQLSFYAAKWELREKRTGGFWPEDVHLLNAARTLWHQRRKTLKESAHPPQHPPAPTGQTPKAAEVLDEDVPF